MKIVLFYILFGVAWKDLEGLDFYKFALRKASFAQTAQKENTVHLRAVDQGHNDKFAESRSYNTPQKWKSSGDSIQNFYISSDSFGFSKVPYCSCLEI